MNLGVFFFNKNRYSNILLKKKQQQLNFIYSFDRIVTMIELNPHATELIFLMPFPANKT